MVRFASDVEGSPRRASTFCRFRRFFSLALAPLLPARFPPLAPPAAAAAAPATLLTPRRAARGPPPPLPRCCFPFLAARCSARVFLTAGGDSRAKLHHLGMHLRLQ